MPRPRGEIALELRLPAKAQRLWQKPTGGLVERTSAAAPDYNHSFAHAFWSLSWPEEGKVGTGQTRIREMALSSRVIICDGKRLCSFGVRSVRQGFLACGGLLFWSVWYGSRAPWLRGGHRWVPACVESCVLLMLGSVGRARGGTSRRGCSMESGKVLGAWPGLCAEGGSARQCANECACPCGVLRRGGRGGGAGGRGAILFIEWKRQTRARRTPRGARRGAARTHHVQRRRTVAESGDRCPEVVLSLWSLLSILHATQPQLRSLSHVTHRPALCHYESHYRRAVHTAQRPSSWIGCLIVWTAGHTDPPRLTHGPRTHTHRT